jgi:transposase-like protein
MKCPHCESQKVVKNGRYQLKDNSVIQHYLCKECRKRFSSKTGTPMARLRTAPEVVALALKMRSEGMGIRASGRVNRKVTLDDYTVGRKSQGAGRILVTTSAKS